MFVNDEVGKPNYAVQIKEGNKLRLSCYISGNPVPDITLSKETGVSRILQRNTKNWLNHTIESLQCSDTGTYKCTGTSTGFTEREKIFGINATCKSIITTYFLNETHNMCVYLFVWGFSSHSNIFHSFGDVIITGEGLQMLTYAQHS